MDLEPTRNEVEVDDIDIYRLEGGKTAETWVQANMMTMMERLRNEVTQHI